MSQITIYWAELRHEIRAGLSGPMFPMAVVGFTLYTIISLTNGDAMRGFGVVRNSATIVYEWSTGMSMYLFFIWAWIFAQVVVRDRNVHLDENVLSSPINLSKLMFARYLGAGVVAFLLGSVVPLSIFLMPLTAWLGLVPQADIGAAPVVPVLLSMLFFVLPTTLGLGALFVKSALWTRSTAGPFAVAAVLMLVWMFGMIVLRGGDINENVAAMIDPTLFSEVTRQIEDLTPNEKVDYIIDLSQPYVINRLLCFLLPMGLLLIRLQRLKREHLLLDNNKKTVGGGGKKVNLPPTKRPVSVMGKHKPSWLRALVSETLWHSRISLQSKGLILALGVLLVMNVGISVMFVLQNGQGPIVPHVEYLLTFSNVFFYLFTLFAVAGFVGALMRRDQRSGFEEMFDATPAPLGTRFIARILAAFFITMVLVLLPVLNIWIVMAIGGMTIAWWDPLIFQSLVILPAMLEMAALTVVSHSLIRNAGGAYGFSMMLGFIAMMNAELDLVPYPPAQVAMGMPLSLSSLSGWQPWLASLLSTGLLKLGITFVLAALAWLSWPRGVDSGLSQRWHMVQSRIRSVAPLAIAGLLLIAIPGIVLYEKLVRQGEYQSLETELAEDAAWEKKWWEKGNAYSLQGGDVRIQVNPSKRKFTAQWILNNVQSAEGLLHGSLPHGVSISEAVVDGLEVIPDTGYEHFALALGRCQAQGCNVKLTLKGKLEDWPANDVQSWLEPSGVWLRAKDVLPTLGLDPDRRLRIPAERTQFGLPKLTDNLPRHAMKAAETVAPAGSWRWSVQIDTKGASTKTSGSLKDPLDFAMVWLPRIPDKTTQNGIQAWHGDKYREAAKGILEDLQLMKQYVGDLLGQEYDVRYVIQAPRELGEIVQYGELLWLPENLGWDIANKGPGRERRRAAIASALSRHILLQAADLRAESGAEWLLSGVSGWIGMECLRRCNGQDAWIAEQDWLSKELANTLGGKLEAPVTQVADVGNSSWIKTYTALSTLNWAAGQGTEQTIALIKALLKQLKKDKPLPEALAVLAGQETAERLLGMPIMTDIELHADDKLQTQVKAQRWQWQGKGWQLVQRPCEVLQLLEQDTQLINLQKSGVINPSQDFVVLDSWPSVERTPKNNVWRNTAKP